jgi:TonB family protein
MPAEAYTGAKGCVVLKYTILRSGHLSGVGALLMLRSGDQELDDAAVKAIDRSAPFYSLPDTFRGSFVVIRFTFLYNIQDTAPKPKAYLDPPAKGDSYN